jgi:nitrite reductase/ring-hydroxylating ferredoxin subunit
MARYVVGLAASFGPDEQRHVTVGGRKVAIFHVDGEFRALKDGCPHQGASLACGTVVGALSATDPDSLHYDGQRRLVKCPWHGWEFDLRTGQSWFDPQRERVRAYPVSVASGDSLLATAEASPGLQPGPFVAETVEISVEEDYVVIEI